jgi:type IV pilus assembly protein PilM
MQIPIPALKKLASMSGVLGRIAPQGFPIGVDFGTRGMKILQLTQSETPTLAAAAYVETPEALLGDIRKRMAYQLETLPKALKSGGFKLNRVACAIPSPLVYCKSMQVNKADAAATGAIIEGALAAQLQTDPAKIVHRYVDAGPVGGAGKNEFLAMAVGRDAVQSMMAAVRAARKEPVGMHVEYLATLRSFDSITQRSQDFSLTSLYIDIGHSCTRMLIAHGCELVFARCIETGGRDLDAVVSKRLRCDPAEASAKRRALTTLAKPRGEHGGGISTGIPALDAAITQAEPPPSEDESGAPRQERRTGAAPVGFTAVDLNKELETDAGAIDLSEPLEIITDEIQMGLRYYQSVFGGKRIDRTVFVGGESRHAALCEHIARTLKLPAQVADPLARIARTGNEPVTGVNFKEPQPGWATVLGVCLSPTDL